MFKISKPMSNVLKRAQDLMSERHRIEQVLAAAREELPAATAAIDAAKSKLGRSEVSSVRHLINRLASISTIICCGASVHYST